jgi:predicted SprT family Zn-dependent metalloprotease
MTVRVHHLNHEVWKHEMNHLITHKWQQQMKIKLKARDWIKQLARTCFGVEEVAAGSTNAIQK